MNRKVAALKTALAFPEPPRRPRDELHELAAGFASHHPSASTSIGPAVRVVPLDELAPDLPEEYATLRGNATRPDLWPNFQVPDCSCGDPACCDRDGGSR